MATSTIANDGAVRCESEFSLSNSVIEEGRHAGLKGVLPEGAFGLMISLH
jgi:hypothetical protein